MGRSSKRSSDHDRTARRETEREEDRSEVAAEIVARPVDGTFTNEGQADWGATGQDLLRLAPNAFADGLGEMVTDLPNAREISNAVAQQDGEIENSFGASDMLWAWGQFIDHDLDLTEGGETEFVPIVAPVDDPVFAPFGLIPFTRVDPVADTGDDDARAYHNEITAFIDGGAVYGSDAETAEALRDGAYLKLDGEGNLLLTEDGGVLAGDIRAAENAVLTSMHTLFAREHNRWVDELAEEDPSLSEDELFDAARMRVEAEIQAITYNDFLPILVGEDVIPDYDGYDPDVNPGISVEFSTAAFRFGHSLLSSELLRLEEDGSSIGAGSMTLQDAFFNPTIIGENGGIDPILRGLMGSSSQELDTMVVEDVRSFLFAEDGATGLDLAAINIQRGRDLGVASYNDLREALGFLRAESFSDVTSDETIADRLEALYGNVDQLDAWVGGLAEDPANGGILGETFGSVIADQFLRVRDGDAYWSEVGHLSEDEVAELWDTTLADVIEANTGIRYVQQNVFFTSNRVGGTSDDDDIEGTKTDDLVLGFDGDDTLRGAGGDDEIFGGAGADLALGGAGDDRLHSSLDGDTLVGGDGQDDYVFDLTEGLDAPDDTGPSIDTIADFSRDDGDVIEIDGDISAVDVRHFKLEGGTDEDINLSVINLSMDTGGRGGRSEVIHQIVVVGEKIEARDFDASAPIKVERAGRRRDDDEDIADVLDEDVNIFALLRLPESELVTDAPDSPDDEEETEPALF